MATYSLNFKGVPASNSQQPLSMVVSDDVCNSPAAEQQAMMLGTPFLIKTPSGQQVLMKYDAERSIPGVLRVLQRV